MRTRARTHAHTHACAHARTRTCPHTALLRGDIIEEPIPTCAHARHARTCACKHMRLCTCACSCAGVRARKLVRARVFCCAMSSRNLVLAAALAVVVGTPLVQARHKTIHVDTHVYTKVYTRVNTNVYTRCYRNVYAHTNRHAFSHLQSRPPAAASSLWPIQLWPPSVQTTGCS